MSLRSVEELVKKKVFIERVTRDNEGKFLCSNVERPTLEQIQEFIDRGCVHDSSKDKLVYDVPGWLFDQRFCALCDTHLGHI